MNRTNPNFKEQTLIAQDNLDFIDELFSNLLDNDDISSDFDRIPDLGEVDRRAT
jgi:hypothetical protein